ncbi:hypothetical protein H5410_003733 [Solanum commersonii]|uniref:Uncharacterized protein n=1 Tax=Solanum commersonii TaxID=4109 RepID=A0A9J6B5U5_SOLCO|nr:hypothetical protein H5410_003733 [Solanum commersonii]
MGTRRDMYLLMSVKNQKSHGLTRRVFVWKICFQAFSPKWKVGDTNGSNLDSFEFEAKKRVVGRHNGQSQE